MLSSESRSLRVTNAPMRSPSSWMACTVTLTRFGPSPVCSSVSAATSLSSSLSMCSASCSGCPAGKISVTRRPRNWPAGWPRNFSAAGLIITARESFVNNSSPSSRPAMTEFMFSRMVLKISCTPRNCWPTWVIFRLTAPSSSPLPPMPFNTGDGTSYCPAEIRSNCAAISCKGASVALLTMAASKVETTTARNAIIAEFTRTSPNGFFPLVNG